MKKVKPQSYGSDLVTFSILSNESQIDETYQVQSVYVERSVNKIPFCEIELMAGSATAEDFSTSDSDTFTPGNKIEVKAGYDLKEMTIFKGIVLKQNLKVSAKEASVLRVLCLSEAVKMTVGRKNACFKDTTDGDVMAEIISNYGLTVDAAATNTSLSELIQFDTTDWDFVVTRADVNGMVVIAEDDKVVLQRPENAKNANYRLTYGDNIYGIDVVLDAQNQYKSVRATAWDGKTQNSLDEEVTPANQDISNLSTSTLADVIGLDVFDLQSVAGIKDDRLKDWAGAGATKSTFAKVRGTVEFQGNAKATPGSTITLEGLGDRFNGKAYISGIVHNIKDGNWMTTAQLGLSPEWYAEQAKAKPAAAGLLAGTQGLQMGKVKQLAGDPDGEHRILVKLPLIDKEKGVWARLANFYATAGAGAFFNPEINDEVIVGFLNDDPRFPIILGSVYSSSKAANDTLDDDNHIKSFVTREKMTISFDEEKKEILIQTPANNELVLSDDDQMLSLKDQNGNSIQLSADGIAINSIANIQINAGEGNISISGREVSANATSELSLSADASASLSASAEVSINGALVMIN